VWSDRHAYISGEATHQDDVLEDKAAAVLHVEKPGKELAINNGALRVEVAVRAAAQRDIHVAIACDGFPSEGKILANSEMQ
jgi:hypothetical protein